MMLRKLFAPVLVASLVLVACDQASTAPVADDQDYALLMFGEQGASLEGTMGPQSPERPFDGRTGAAHFPDSIALTLEQREAIAALRAEFRTAHAAELDALKAIFQAARDARQAGATREEVRAILEEGRPIAMGLRPALWALHEAIREILTPAQRFWLFMHRPFRFPPPIARP